MEATKAGGEIWEYNPHKVRALVNQSEGCGSKRLLMNYSQYYLGYPGLQAWDVPITANIGQFSCR